MTSSTGSAGAATAVADHVPSTAPQAPRSAAGRYLTFVLHDEVYALDIMKVTEIIEFRSLTVVPMMPPSIRGVINLRGRVLPVIDLAARFGQGATQVARRTGILVVEGRQLTPGAPREDETVPSGGETPLGVGIMVDAVSKVVQLGDDDIAGPPSFGGGLRAAFVSGMARLDDDFAVVLDIDRILSMQEAAPSPAASLEPGDDQ